MKLNEGASKASTRKGIQTSADKKPGITTFQKLVVPKSSKTEDMFLKSTIAGMNELLRGGYPKGAIINLVGVPKCGKTTYAIQESLGLGMLGHRVLYVFNESPVERFLTIFNKHRKDMRIPEKVYENLDISLLDRTGKVVKSAQYASIERSVKQDLISPITSFFRDGLPDLIVIDSFSKFVRRYPAQAFVYVEYLMSGLNGLFQKSNHWPVVILINQKSTGFNERNTESVLGGLGIVHELDGSIVIRTELVDFYTARDTALDRGTKQRFLRIESLRDLDVNEDEHILLKERGRLKIGPALKTLMAANSEGPGE